MYIYAYIYTHTFTQGIYMAHIHQGDENPDQRCLPGNCPSLDATCSVPLSPFLSRDTLVEKTKRSGEDSVVSA